MDGGVEHGEHGIVGKVRLGRNGVSMRVGMQGVAIDALAQVYAALDGWDAIDFHIVDMGAELFSPKVVEICDGIVVGFHRVVPQPSF